jgi:hypothetical protein
MRDAKVWHLVLALILSIVMVAWCISDVYKDPGWGELIALALWSAVAGIDLSRLARRVAVRS